MLPTPLEQITEADLQRLVVNKTAEGRTLEFKQELPDPKKTRSVRDQLQDITAFANAQGGDLIYGVKDEKGVAAEVCGVDHPDLNELQQGIEGRLRDTVKPRSGASGRGRRRSPTAAPP